MIFSCKLAVAPGRKKKNAGLGLISRYEPADTMPFHVYNGTSGAGGVETPENNVM